MNIRVETVVNFQDGKAECSLPKGAKGFRITSVDHHIYLSALVDSNQTEKDTYQLLSFDEEQRFDDNEIEFLGKVDILGAGVFYWYYKIIS